MFYINYFYNYISEKPKYNSLLFKFLFLLISITSIAQIDDKNSYFPSTSNGKDEAAQYAKLLQESYNTGAYEMSKLYSDSLLLVSEIYNLKEMSVMALNSQAIYFKNRNNREKAILLYRDALARVDEIPNNQGPKSMILVNMGNIYTNLGEYEKSIRTMDTLLKITDTIRSFSKIRLAALSGQFENFLKLEELEKANFYIQKSLHLAEKMQEPQLIQSVLSSLSDLDLKLENYEDALIHTRKGLELTKSNYNTSTTSSLLLNNGIAHYELGHTNEAIIRLQKALDIANDKDLNEIKMHTHKYLSEIYELEKDYKKSYEAQKEYTRLKSIIFADTKNASVIDLKEDLKEKNALLNNSRQQMDSVVKEDRRKIILSVLLTGFLIFLLLFYKFKKRKLEREKAHLQNQFVILKDEMASQGSGIRDSKVSELPRKPYSNSSLTESDIKLQKQIILQYTRLEKPYLNADLKLNDFAKKLNLSAAHLSEILHYGFKQNFNNYINSNRVLEAQNLMKREGFKDAKLMAIAFDAGFKSKTTFNRVFKDITGLTPSDYRKSLYDL